MRLKREEYLRDARGWALAHAAVS